MGELSLILDMEGRLGIIVPSRRSVSFRSIILLLFNFRITVIASAIQFLKNRLEFNHVQFHSVGLRFKPQVSAVFASVSILIDA